MEEKQRESKRWRRSNGKARDGGEVQYLQYIYSRGRRTHVVTNDRSVFRLEQLKIIVSKSCFNLFGLVSSIKIVFFLK
jgi:hypothetical protein